MASPVVECRLKGTWASVVVAHGLSPLLNVESSQARDGTHVPHIVGWTPIHCTIREVLGQGISNKFLGNAYDDVGKILEIDMSFLTTADPWTTWVWTLGVQFLNSKYYHTIRCVVSWIQGYGWTVNTGGSDSKGSTALQETQVRSLGWEDPLEKGMTLHPGFLPGELDRGALQVIVHGVSRSWTWLSN